jgi:hypothetical protein
MTQTTEEKKLGILRAMNKYGTGSASIDNIRTSMLKPIGNDEIQDLLEIMEQSKGYVKTESGTGVGGNGIYSARLTSQGRQYLREKDE